MPELKTLENEILDALTTQGRQETSLPQLLETLHSSGALRDDVVIRMALWPLISQHKVELTPGFNLKVGSTTPRG
jgi:hypothetical protein